jgi:uncharacterized membrane protein
MELLGIFVAYPWLALVVAGLLAVLWRRTRGKAAAWAALLWAGYAGYEYLMFARVLCSGECNIRVDLVLIYPLLLLVSVVAIIRGAHRVTP